MPRSRVSMNVHSPTVDVIIDMGHPLLNRIVDGFLKIGTVGAVHAAAQDIYINLKKGSVTKHDLKSTVKRMGKGMQYGVVAGVYCGTHYGIERIRGRCDWVGGMDPLMNAYLLWCMERGQGIDFLALVGQIFFTGVFGSTLYLISTQPIMELPSNGKKFDSNKWVKET